MSEAEGHSTQKPSAWVRKVGMTWCSLWQADLRQMALVPG